MPRGRYPRPPRSPLGLTSREEQVLLLVADGLSYSEIGVRLGERERTVQDHRNRAVARLGARSTPHAVAILLTAGAS